MDNNLYFYSKQLLKLLQDNQEIIKLINSIEKLKSSYIINPQDLINVPTDINSRSREMGKIQNQIKAKNQEILKVIRSKRPNKVFQLINSFLTDLNLFDSSFNDDSQLVKQLKEFPENHTDAYSEKSSDYIFSLIENSNKIIQSLNDLENKAGYVIKEFNKSGKTAPIDYLPLRIGTDQDVPLLEEFILIFTRIENLYNFVCYIYKIDKNNKPIILDKISTGSWYSELLGINQVVISLENLLKGIGQFIRDFITGKIDRERFENICKKQEAFIHLMKVAEENDIKNADLGIFKELNPLVENFKSDTTTILEINEEEVLKLKKLEKMTLLEKKKKREELLEKINLSIEEGKENNNNDGQ